MPETGAAVLKGLKAKQHDVVDRHTAAMAEQRVACLSSPFKPLLTRPFRDGAPAPTPDRDTLMTMSIMVMMITVHHLYGGALSPSTFRTGVHTMFVCPSRKHHSMCTRLSFPGAY